MNKWLINKWLNDGDDDDDEIDDKWMNEENKEEKIYMAPGYGTLMSYFQLIFGSYCIQVNTSKWENNRRNLPYDIECMNTSRKIFFLLFHSNLNLNVAQCYALHLVINKRGMFSFLLKFIYLYV